MMIVSRNTIRVFIFSLVDAGNLERHFMALGKRYKSERELHGGLICLRSEPTEAKVVGYSLKVLR